MKGGTNPLTEMQNSGLTALPNPVYKESLTESIATLLP